MSTSDHGGGPGPAGPDEPLLGPRHPDRPTARVVVVDDVELARRRAVVALEVDPDVEVVAEVGSLDAGLDLLAATRPDAVVVPLVLAGDPGPGPLAAVRRAAPEAAVVVLVTAEDDHLLGGALSAPVEGIVAREAAPSDVLRAVRSAVAGGVALTPVAAGALSDRAPAAGGPELRRCLALLASGVASAEVAEDVGWTPLELDRAVGRAVRAVAEVAGGGARATAPSSSAGA